MSLLFGRNLVLSPIYQCCLRAHVNDFNAPFHRLVLCSSKLVNVVCHARVRNETTKTWGTCRATCTTHLLCEPLVQFLAAVQHQPLPLGTFLALGHQCGVVIALKQPWNLPTTPKVIFHSCFSLFNPLTKKQLRQA